MQQRWIVTRRAVLGAVAAVALSASVSAFQSAQSATWKYAFEEALHKAQGDFATKFKEVIEKNSDHRVQLFPHGTLGKSADIMEQTQAGIIEFADQSPGFTGALIHEVQVFFVPCLLPSDIEQLNAFFRNSKVIHEDFKGLYAAQGLEPLTMFPDGEVAMTTKKEADLIALGSRGLGDLKGYLLASVSHKVTSLADCPVLVV